MPIIEPITEVQDNWTAIADIAEREQRPILLKKNGYDDMVVMNIHTYEDLFIKLDVYSKLAEAQQEIANGDKGVDIDTAFERIMGKEWMLNIV